MNFVYLWSNHQHICWCMLPQTIFPQTNFSWVVASLDTCQSMDFYDAVEPLLLNLSTPFTDCVLLKVGSKLAAEASKLVSWTKMGGRGTCRHYSCIMNWKWMKAVLRLGWLKSPASIRKKMVKWLWMTSYNFCNAFLQPEECKRKQQKLHLLCGMTGYTTITLILNVQIESSHTQTLSWQEILLWMKMAALFLRSLRDNKCSKAHNYSLVVNTINKAAN